MTASELADELEARAVELETFASSRPEYDTPPAFAGVLRQSASSLRRVEKLEWAGDELLKCVSYFRDAKTLGEQAGRGEELARKVEITIRQTLTGEA
jgi:hypothetical protein